MVDGGMGAIFEAVLRQWKAVLLLVVPLLVGAVAAAESLPNEYSARAVVAFTPRIDRDPSADVIRLTLPKYTVFVTSAPTVRSVGTEIGVEPAAVADGLDATIPADTATLEIRQSGRSPRVAVDAANAFADRAVELADDDDLVEATVVARAVEPTSPSGPPRRLMEAAAVVAALVLGVALALAVEHRRPRVRSALDAGTATGLRVLGRIPRSRAARQTPHDALLDSRIGAAVRTLRTNIDRESQRTPVQVLAVTSAEGGDGKTTVAALVAAAIARLDVRVLLVDADLLRPKLAEQFNIPSAPGLVDVLTGSVPLEDAPSDIGGGLCVLPTSPSPESGDVVSREFPRFLRDARNQYDVVIIDSPPVIDTDAGATISALADGALLVVAGGTLRGLAAEAASALESVGARVLGVVANRVRGQAGHYGYTAERRR